MSAVPKMRESGRASSSPGLSSPPTPSSPNYGISANQPAISSNFISHSHNTHGGAQGGGEKAKASYVPESANPAAKKVRKKRDPTTVKKQSDSKSTANSSNAPDVKEPIAKPRKQRAAPATTSKRKSKFAISSDDQAVPTPLSQSRITDSLAPGLFANINAHPAAEPYQNGKNEAIPISQDTGLHSLTPTPRSSGQNYDPVRSSTIQPRSFPPTPSQQVLRSSTPPRAPNFGSASNSPSISSLIDHPQHMKHDNDYRALSPPPKKQRLTPPDSMHTQALPITLNQDGAHHTAVGKAIVREETQDRVNHVSSAHTVSNIAAAPMEIDPTQQPAKAAAVKRKSTTTSGTSTPANSLKPPRQKDTPLPMGSGNGLLSTEMLGGGPGNSEAEKTAPTVILDVPLNGEHSKYVNFARLAEERYGFSALYPRLAAQRERLARVAAAGAALEKDNKANSSGMSGDEMSVDLSEGEGAGDDSNVEMGGMNLIERDVLGAGTPAEGSEGGVRKRKKRVMKEDQYDKDDPFVDDAELAWEEQAAISNDGFFVYSGPLVPEGEKPNVERYGAPTTP